LSPAARRTLGVFLPLLLLALLLGAWQAYAEWLVSTEDTRAAFVPTPSRIAETLVSDWPLLGRSLRNTLELTLLALAVALVGAVVLAVLFAEFEAVEAALAPYVVVLQVTPVIAIAPLLLVFIADTTTVLLILAFLVAFFPVLSNTVQGLKSVDHNLLALFELYRAPRWKRLVYLKIPSALPYFLTGLRIGGGLALIAAVVAEFAAGVAGAGSGLAFRILESGYRLNYPRMYAALILLAGSGVVIYGITSLISHLALRRWHESALGRER
jgi:NitT/TauT family transport system permease protein